jgi:hypothetical protein
MSYQPRQGISSGWVASAAAGLVGATNLDLEGFLRGLRLAERPVPVCQSFPDLPPCAAALRQRREHQ